VGSRHQEQNREGGKAQNGQDTTCWVKLLQYISQRIQNDVSLNKPNNNEYDHQ
jgi:hypothetical protein